jgi:large subunit ribosomal protein L22
MPGLKTNEAPGTRAVLRHYRMSAYKAREVLDLIRGRDADRAEEILNATPREAARVVGKVLASAVANARNNDQLDPDELFVSACFADEGTTLKRWRPRARGRATRIRKRTGHITVIVSRLPEDRLERRRARRATETSGLRSRRVAASRRGEGDGTDEGRAPGADATGSDAEDLDTGSTDVLDNLDDHEEAVDEAGTEVDGTGADGTELDGTELDDTEVHGDEEDFEEPAWLDEVDAGTESDVTPGSDHAGTDEAVEADEADDTAPPTKARRARVRKATKKAAAEADDSDSGASGDEEKD